MSVVKQASNLFTTHLLKTQALVMPMWSLMAICLFGQTFLLPVLLEDDSLSLSYESECWLLLLHQACEIPGMIALSLIIDHPSIGRKKAIAMSSAATAISALLMAILLQHGFWCLLIMTLVLKFFAIMPFQGERKESTCASMREVQNMG
jgi:hypothetical protein